MFDYPYPTEILDSKRSNVERIEDQKETFAERYCIAVDSGSGVPIPDNPMGSLVIVRWRQLNSANHSFPLGRYFQPMDTKQDLQRRIDSARIFHESTGATADKPPFRTSSGVPSTGSGQADLATYYQRSNSLRFPGGKAIYTVSRQQFVKYPG